MLVALQGPYDEQVLHSRYGVDAGVATLDKIRKSNPSLDELFWQGFEMPGFTSDEV